ncbi:MAG: excalibur calcium-binding domain-containing protein, partial [Ruegeria sp.]
MKKTSLSSDELIPNPRSAKRLGRAEAQRKQALSPVRILTMVLALPITTGMIALGVYMRTTDYEPTQAVAHIVALAGCEAARAVGIGPVRVGEPGYHKRNDPDGDGVACGASAVVQPQSVTVAHTE